MKKRISWLRGVLLGVILSAFVGGSANAQRPYGVDVSHWNGSNVNFVTAYSNGYRFVFAKSSESTWYHDTTVHTNMTKAKAAGLVIGPYHFARPLSNTGKSGATNEANWMVNIAGQYMTNGYLRPVLDLEEGSSLSTTALSDWANAFCNRVKQLKNVSPIIYCNSDYAANHLNTSVTNWGLWIAQWPFTPDPQNGQPASDGVWPTWTFWQYAGDVSGVAGFPSSIDLNVYNGTLAGLQTQIIGGGTNPPSIAIQPSGLTVASNQTANFTVVAIGGSLVYKWQKNSVNVNDGGHYSGTTTPTLTVSTADGNDAANYRCVITNTYGSVTSSQAALAVTASCDATALANASFEGGNTGGVGTSWTGYQRSPAPSTVWTIQTASPPAGGGTQYQQIANTSSTGGGGVRQDITGCNIGGTYAISGWMRGNSSLATARVRVSPTASTNWATAVDLDPPQSVNGSTWTSFSGSVVATATSMTLWLDGQTGGAGENKAECFDAITVTCEGLPPQPPVISQQPVPATNCTGTTASFSVAATGSGTLTYHWQTNSVDLTDGSHYGGTGTATLSVTNVSSSDAVNYACRVSNAGGWTNSTDAALTVWTATSITTQPANRSIPVGGTTNFTVAATGQGTVTYQWQKNSVDLSNTGHYSGVTTTTLTISNADTNDTANYRCVATSGCGDATSFQAALTIGCAPSALLNPSFELGNISGLATNWTAYSRSPAPSTSYSIQTASPPSGGGTQYQQIANTSSTGGAGVRQDLTGCTIGATYTIAGWMRGNSASATCTVKASPTASTNWATAVNLSPTQTYSGSTWTAFSGTVVATGTSMTIWLDGQTTSTGLNKAECFDAIVVTCAP